MQLMSPSRLDRLAQLEKKIDNNIRKKKSTKQKKKWISSSYRIKDLDIFDRVGKYIIFNDEKISFFYVLLY